MTLDLDSIASSIGYSWIETKVYKRPTIALIQTKRADLSLRPENLYALFLAGLSAGYEEVLCKDDIPKRKPFPSNRFALVDHNRILSSFTIDNPATHVVGVIDHHDDEGLYQDASPRIIVRSGSCASLVAYSNRDHQLPAELATLLLCAILIDTSGLKVGGKATQEDRAAAIILIPQSTLASSLDPVLLAALTESPTSESGKLHEIPSIHDLAIELSTKKETLTHFGTLDLLRRDYKEYMLTLPSGVTIRAGLSSVPRNLSSCDDLWNWSRKWMAHRGITIHGILTSFRDENKLNKSGRPKHKREMAWVVCQGADRSKIQGLPDDDNDDDDGWLAPRQLDVDGLASKLWAGLEESEELQLKKHNKFKVDEKDIGRTRAYEQGNTDATRKETAPLLKRILETSV
jgi:exopolyphosphatase